VYVLDVLTGEVNSKEVDGLCFSETFCTSNYELPPHPFEGARTLLLNHWVAPRKWLSESRATVVRPSDLPRAPKWIRHSSSDVDGPTTTLCWCKTARGDPVNGYAVFYLRQGFTLLLVVGDLIRVPLPGRKWPLLFVVGMMFKEGEPQELTTEHEEDGLPTPRRAGLHHRK